MLEILAELGSMTIWLERGKAFVIPAPIPKSRYLVAIIPLTRTWVSLLPLPRT